MLRDTWLLCRHQLRLTMVGKIGLLFTLAQPILYLVLFGPLLSTYEGRESWRLFVPGVLIQLCLMSAGMAGFGIVFDVRFGVLERLRVTPVSRLALMLGRVSCNAVVLLAQSVLLVTAGFAFGLRAAPLGLLIGFLVLIPVALGLASLSYAFALALKQIELFPPLTGTIVVPLLLLSGALLPMSSAPAWLNAASRATPFRYVVEALRAAYAGHYGTTLLTGIAVALAFAAVGLALGKRTFTRQSA